MLPAGSIERTEAVCWLSVRPVNVCGLVHGFQEPPSMRHSKVDPDSLEVNVIIETLLGSPGAPVMFVNGAVVSIETLRVADVMCPALSVAVTFSVRLPSGAMFQLVEYGAVVSTPSEANV